MAISFVATSGDASEEKARSTTAVVYVHTDPQRDPFINYIRATAYQ